MKNMNSSDAQKSSPKRAKDSQNQTRNQKTTPRDTYLLEKERIKIEIGDLEQIRLSLGLSQRKLCQLLLVDPSAWTRWLNTDTGAPPHIYQALRWLLEAQKINPGVTTPRNLDSRIDLIQTNTQSRMKDLENHIAILERTVGMAATAQPSTSSDYAIEVALRAQDERFNKEIGDLKAKIALLLESAQAVGRNKKTSRRIKPVKKITKKTFKKSAKKSAKPAKKKVKNKPVTKKRAKPVKKPRPKKKRPLRKRY